ncbi:MAG: hypothetical protein ACI9FB_001248, partial [Candidatus Azotimanducaceae bacterium]
GQVEIIMLLKNRGYEIFKSQPADSPTRFIVKISFK